MCGIIGLVDVSKSENRLRSFSSVVPTLDHRGPDARAHMVESPVALGHTRLSIIDLDERSNQPFTNNTSRYTLVFNGEIYNYRELRSECEKTGFQFRTESDTEVLLALYILHGDKCLQKLNGCFAFCVFDRETRSLFVARDRFGIKPLVYYLDQDVFAFSSELKALMKLDIPKNIDKVSMFNYFKFNYISAPHTILESVSKLEPGHCLNVTFENETVQCELKQWYSIPFDTNLEKDLTAHDYQQSKKVLKRFVRESVRRRLVADVPVGTFLSGGIDSSIITAIASQESDHIESFSIGFSDQPYFDESKYAIEVAKHLGVSHHILDVKENDLLDVVDQVVQHLDEPFADSSALNVYLLSRFTKQHVKVTLSGDGGDELFGGYHKHGAEFRIRHPKLLEQTISNLGWLWKRLPTSRSSSIGNLNRQLLKFSEGSGMNARDRYWRWAGIQTEEQTNYLLQEKMLQRDQRLSDEGHAYKKRKDQLLRHLSKTGSLNDVLLTDMHMVLPNDMLYKVDSMSMACGLEVRTPLLDQHIVKHAFRLPVMFKVNQHQKKKILTDSFSEYLPESVFNRAKKGFEVPLHQWFQGPLKSRFLAFSSDLDFLEQQGLFNPSAIQDLSKRLFSNNPGDSAATAWAFFVFQTWYTTHFSE